MERHLGDAYYNCMHPRTIKSDRLTPIERGRSLEMGRTRSQVTMPPSLGLQEAAKPPASSLTFMPRVLIPLVIQVPGSMLRAWIEF